MADYYIGKNNQQLGPYTLDQINQLLVSGGINRTDLAWSEGWPTWMPLSEVPGIVSISPTLPPAPSVESLEVSEYWKKKFRLVEKAGKWNGLSWSNGKALSFSEKGELVSLPGLALGPIVYFYLGMWKKGLVILLVGIVLLIVLGQVAPLLAGAMIGAYCGGSVVYDYYQFKLKR